MAVSRDIKFRQDLHKKSVRVRERNLAERRLLTQRLCQIHFGEEKNIATKEHEIRRIQDDIWRQEGLQEFLATENNSSVHFPSINQWASKTKTPESNQSEPSEEISQVLPIKTAKSKWSKSTNALNLASQGVVSKAPSFQSKSTSALWSEVKPSQTRLTSASSCAFELKKLNCDHFPCNKDVTYTRIGFDIRGQGKGCNTFATVKQVFAKSREGLIMDLESQSVRRPMKTSMDQTSRKIASLRTIFVEMKKRSKENRPKDWCVNYGKPISKRKLLKVARPSSVHDLEGL